MLRIPNAVFVTLFITVFPFLEIDSNNDSEISEKEFNDNHDTIISIVKANTALSYNKKQIALEVGELPLLPLGVLNRLDDRVMVTGQFKLADKPNSLQFESTLFDRNRRRILLTAWVTGRPSPDSRINTGESKRGGFHYN